MLLWVEVPSPHSSTQQSRKNHHDELMRMLAVVETQSLVVGDPFFMRGQVPLVVSEWGGFGFPDYGGPADAAERTERIAAFKKELRARGFAGDVHTQATDVENERNGLIDARAGELRVPEGLLDSGP